MKETFDDYKYKNTSKRITLSIKQKKDKNLSPWEISNFVGKFNTYYYQTEVINTISIALSENIDPEDIIIFDESFKLNQTHSKLSYLSIDNKDIKNLYHLGKPVSLLPNTNIYVMNILFKYFRLLNESLIKIKKAKILEKDNLHLYYSKFRSKDFDALHDFISKDVRLALSKSSIESSQREKINKILNRFNLDFSNYSSDLKEINNIKKYLLKNELNKIDFKSDTFKKYFNKFKNLIRIIQRPILAVSNSDKSFTILCRAQINKKEKNAVTLKLRSMTHNSPISLVMEGGATLYKTFQHENREDELHTIKIQQEKTKLETLRVDLDKSKLQLEYQKLEILNRQHDVISNFNEIENLNKKDNINQIPNPYLKYQIQDLQNKIIKKSTDLLDKAQFGIVVEDCTVSDFEEIYA